MFDQKTEKPENLGRPNEWHVTKVAPGSYPNYLLQLVDINNDGHLDIISEATDHGVISYFENVGNKDSQVSD